MSLARRRTPGADPRAQPEVAAKLALRAAQHAAVAQLGTWAVSGLDAGALMRAACEVSSRTLGLRHAVVFEHLPAGERLDARPACGYPDRSLEAMSLALAGAPGAAKLSSSPAAGALAKRAACVLEASPRRGHDPVPAWAQAEGVSPVVAVPIDGAQAPFGVLELQGSHAPELDETDLHFLTAIANVVAVAIERLQSEARLRHQALHDAVTGLPNRTLFEDRLTQALTLARRHGRTVAVLFLDLDDFKRVNDMLGHGGGDQLLRQVAERLERCVRSSDTVARFGGDEFAILLAEVNGAGGAKRVAEQVLTTMRTPVEIDNREVRITASIGLALGGLHNLAGVEDIVRSADLAMYAAKANGKDSVAHYADQMHDQARREAEMVSDLELALERDEFKVRYQPIVRLSDHRLVAVEALVRWEHPTRGLLTPDQFLPLAERSELIVPIDRIVLRKACEQTRAWQRSSGALAEMTVSVNLAAQQVRTFDLIPHVRSVLADAELEPEYLQLEMTEHALVANETSIDAQMKGLKGLGVRLAVDDFGTGFSALSYLPRFPLDVLKIDRSFISAIGSKPQGEQLVEGIIALAHGLNLKTVAEGIETPEQARSLCSMRSDLGQGYLFGKPTPPREDGGETFATTASFGRGA